MNPQTLYDFGARHMLTQNKRCMNDTCCTCQLGTLRCVVAAFAVESDVTSYAEWNFRIPSLLLYEDHCLLGALAYLHDHNLPSCWPDKLHELALKHSLQPFGISDLSSGRGRSNPLAVWYTDPAKREELQALHVSAGTSYLLEDYCKQFPINA